MFTCPACNVKSISLFKKWKTFKSNPQKCSNCGSGYYLKPRVYTLLIGVTSILYTILIIYCLFNLTWEVGIITFSVIIALEILVTSFIPLVIHQESDTTIKPITKKELISSLTGALLFLGIFGGVILYPEYPIFKILFWIFGILAISTPFFLNKK